MSDVKNAIIAGKTVLGIEFGSTRIKAVLIDEKNIPIASGSHEWENQLVNGIWTYDLDEAWKGVQACYWELKKDVYNKFMEYKEMGLFEIKPFEKISEKELNFVYEDMKRTIEQYDLKNNPDSPMSGFIKLHFSKVWME